ncbi:enoyl-CoA hydratase [Rhodovulum sp. DZ06]|uniref:enoyl-CoA hydratase n=1 Tax=Rhodovulum sp. DZ06 TaxID=3425126 RepID=UPI003D330C0A
MTDAAAQTRDEDPILLCERREGVALVTLNRPQAMNAMNRAMRRDLAQLVRDLGADDAIRVLVLTGAGTRAFTAGLDLKELGSGESKFGEGSAQDDPVVALENFPKPIICAVNGVAVTGGFEMALVADILIGSENARFADTHARMAIMPGWGLTQRLPRIIGVSRYKEMAFTGDFIDAATAAEWGLINRVVPADQLVEEAMKIAAKIAESDPEFIAAERKLIDEGLAGSFADGMKAERAASRAWNASRSAADLEARRKKVTERGRTQV